MNDLRALSICDGISCGLLALKSLGISVEYIAIEIDKTARMISNANNPGILRPKNDAYEITKDDVIAMGKIDIFMAGPECTSLSSQGKRDDWDGKSKIFFKVAEICEWVKELNPDVKILFENVASMRNNSRDDMCRVLKMDHYEGFSALTSGQGRKRYYWFNWDAPEIVDMDIDADELLDDDGLHVVAFTKSNRNKPGEPAVVKGRQRSDAKSATITTGEGGRGQSTINYVITKKLKIRPLSVRECARLQNIPDSYDFSMVADRHAYKAIGNAWEIGMVGQLLGASFK